MKELLKLGVYTLLGTLLLSAPFAGLGMLSTHLVTEKTFWIQLIALFLSAVSLQGLWLNPSKGLCPWTYVDILPLSLLGLILLSYPYSIHPEPEKLLFIGQMVVLWYLLRQVFHEYPVLIGYFSMFFIATGLIEAIWGFRQLQGWAYSNHSLFRLTGSFFNPGPYSGYLAMILPVCLHQWLTKRGEILCSDRNDGKGWKKVMDKVGAMVAGGVMLLIFCVLPAGMSRSAWLAAGVSCLCVYAWHMDWTDKFRLLWQQQRQRVVMVVVGGFCVLLLAGYLLFVLKPDSARGRLFMWKITCRAIAEKPLTGYGIHNFAAAYGNAQETYFAAGDYEPWEERVAGSPEYAFNEYLQVAVELGIPLAVCLLVVVVLCLYRGVRKGRYGICGAILSLMIFSFSSYPLQLPVFIVTFGGLLVACLSGADRWQWLGLAQ